jgi:hypothetical protein
MTTDELAFPKLKIISWNLGSSAGKKSLNRRGSDFFLWPPRLTYLFLFYGVKGKIWTFYQLKREEATVDE